MVQLDVTGFNVMKKFIYAVETRGAELIYALVILTQNAKVLAKIWFILALEDNMSCCFLSFFSSVGIDEQGLYRIAGVNSRVQKLLNLAMGADNTL